jgi:Leucine-rich repeat (LRR) protein
VKLPKNRVFYRSGEILLSNIGAIGELIMGSDWDYINEHMGGHDEDGLPNFMSAPGFADDEYKLKEFGYFETFQEAVAWAKNNPNQAIMRSPIGDGYIKKKDYQNTKDLLSVSSTLAEVIQNRLYDEIHINFTKDNNWSLWIYSKGLKHKTSLKISLKDIRQFEQIKELKINCYNHINELPEEIKQFIKQLKKLALLKCDSLVKLPIEIFNLKQLRELSISNCGIIPDEIRQLTDLQVLSLGNSEIPRIIFQLTKLRVLRCSRCYGELPKEIGKLTHLKELYLNGYSYTELPKEIGQLYQLEVLCLEQCNLVELPIEICNLKQLRELSICNCDIKKIPDEISQLSDLQVLFLCYLGDCEISKIVFQLTQLRVLVLQWSGGYGELPKEIGKLTHLKELYLNGYSYTELPKEIGQLCQLEVLCLEECGFLKNLPNEIGQLKRLKTLNLDHCIDLKELPKEIGKLKQLRDLNIDGNQALKQLPKEIRELKQLKIFNPYGISTESEI